MRRSSFSSPRCCSRYHLHPRCVATVIIYISDVSLPTSSASSICRCCHHLHLRRVATITICIFDVSQSSESPSACVAVIIICISDVLQPSSSASSMCCRRHHLYLRCGCHHQNLRRVAPVRIFISMYCSHHHLHL